MYYLVFLVLDDLGREAEVLDAWQSAGVSGITIIESTGLARMRQKEGFREGVPLMPSIRDFMLGREENHLTLFSVVEGEEMVQRLIGLTEAITGRLDEPATGILFAVPVSHVAGLPRRERSETD